MIGACVSGQGREWATRRADHHHVGQRICTAPSPGDSRDGNGGAGIPLASGGFLTQFCLRRTSTHHTRPSDMKRIAIHLIPLLLLSACLTEPNQCVTHPSDPATETFAAS